MSTIRYIALSLSLLMLCSLLHAQEPNKRAYGFFAEAQKSYQLRQLDRAEQLLLKAIKADDNFAEPHFFLADIYIEVNRIDDALRQYKTGHFLAPKKSSGVCTLIAEIELQEGHYDSALYYFERSKILKGTSTLLSNYGKLLEQSCIFAIKAIKHPVPFNPINLGPNINSKFSEYFPSLTVDDSTLLFTRRLKATSNEQARYAIEQEDFFVSKKNKFGNWKTAIPIGPPINSALNEGAPTLSADGQTLIFTACGSHGYYGKKREGFGSCDLFISNNLGEGEWSMPENLGEKINSAIWESQPSFSADGKTLYFIKASQGKNSTKQDIWISTKGSNGKFEEPTKLDSTINTPYTEESVFIHPDGKTLYFSSDGHPGMGGLDIFVTKKQEDGSWSKPQNLGYPINTHNDENSIMISSDGTDGYFASDRVGGFGGLDLYKFTLPEESRPMAVSYMKGVVYDAVTHKPLKAYFELLSTVTGEKIIQSHSNQTSGEFMLVLPQNQNYALNVSREGYLFYSEHFIFEGIHSKIDPFIRNIPLQPLKVGQVTVLRNLFFDTDKYVIKKESVVELTKLLEFMANNPSLFVEISGHTDNVGQLEHNIRLSDSRAKAVYNYLISNGIQRERLKFKGYGEQQPVKSNDTEEGRAMNRRTELKILSL